jgi:general secretion pathway protein G
VDDAFTMKDRPKISPRASEKTPRQRNRGFSVLELTLVLAVGATLSALAIPMYTNYVEKARVVQAMAGVKGISLSIKTYDLENGFLPGALSDVGENGKIDPWGNPYVYKDLTGLPPGESRKDKFLIPLNSDYDLYSKGKDGATQLPLTVPVSKDDVIRANNGGFIGLADLY